MSNLCAHPACECCLCVCACDSLYSLCHSYLLAKTSVDGQTRHASIFASNLDQSLLFQYLPRGLSGGFRTVSVSNIDLSAGGSFHHLAVVVYRNYLSVFLDGILEHRGQLVAEVEDGSEAVTLVGRRAEGTSRFQGKNHQRGLGGRLH